MPELRLTRRARIDIEALGPALQEAVLATVEATALDPGLGKPLVGRLRGLWSARVGAYRVLYTVESRLVVVRAVRHRGAAYSS